jgi:streptogramin lyase
MRHRARALRTALCLVLCAAFASTVLASEIGAGASRAQDWRLHCLGGAHSVAVGSDGRMFVAAMASNQILAYDPRTGAFDRWPLGSGTLPRTVAVGPSGRIYFAAIGGAIGALEPSTGRIERYAMDAPSTPYWVAAASSGRIWFSDPGAMRLASLDPASGSVETFPVLALPHAITVDARDRVWVTLPEDDRLGMLNPRTGLLHRVYLGAGARPRGIVAARDGVWTILEGPGTVMRIEGPRARDIVEYRPPPRFGPPVGLAIGRDGAVWVTFRDTPRVWRIGSHSGTPQTVQPAIALGERILYQETAGVRSCAVAGGV